ncbi:Rv1680 family SBP-like protein [Lolliginicoccus suaedae]|uniref:Rv1680 family SBP-like protein n=1 Tax=Lolliginicoccus suaedae TaxID=2605429 RepID=UPI0011ED27DA|nr:PhnD/SsuA/transferrin family substrate-binding protein [Lolliginicoccus suaedae]
MTDQIIVGAVAYSPNMVPIWEGIRDYFRDPETGDPSMDFVLYSNYARLVDSLIAGHVDIAWNTNLAYARAMMQTDGKAVALAQRDTDTTFSTVFVARAGSQIEGPDGIAGSRLALGSADSAHAAILPLHYLAKEGVTVDAMSITRFNSDIGKHGDTGRSELDAIAAVLAGEADVAAIGNVTWDAMGTDDLMPGSLEVAWQTPEYCHCMFTAMDTLPEERYGPWVEQLLAMDWENPEHRKILELEGLRKWVRPHLDGYQSLFTAIEEQGVDPRW